MAVGVEVSLGGKREAADGGPGDGADKRETRAACFAGGVREVSLIHDTRAGHHFPAGLTLRKSYAVFWAAGYRLQHGTCRNLLPSKQAETDTAGPFTKAHHVPKLTQRGKRQTLELGYRY